MTINTNHPTCNKDKVISRNIDEFFNEFKSLDELPDNVDIENNKLLINEALKADYHKYHQIQDFRRPKFQEGIKTNTFRLNRSYTRQEIKQIGFQLKSEGNSQQQKTHHPIILSEFIL